MGATACGAADGSESQEHPVLTTLWAQRRIADLSNRLVESSSTEYVQMIRQRAPEYGLMSAYTAFVAVDSLTKNRQRPRHHRHAICPEA